MRVLLTEEWPVLRVLQASAELLGLLGHQADRKSALVLLCEVATRIGDSEFLLLAAGDLLKMGDGQLKGVENLEKMLKTSKSKQTHLESFHVPVGIAYAMFCRGDAARAAVNASELLKELSKVNASSFATTPFLDRDPIQ